MAFSQSTSLSYNNYVPDMTYHSDVEYGQEFTADLGTPVATDVDGIIASVASGTAGDVAAAGLAAAYAEANMAPYGRGLIVDADGATVSVVTFDGFDYLGQPITENITAAGTAAVLGKKAFKGVSRVRWTANGAANLILGWSDILGLPFAATGLIDEYLDGAKAANAGTFVPAVGTQTATSGDPRGTYLPSTLLPNGIRRWKLTLMLNHASLHGARHYAV